MAMTKKQIKKAKKTSFYLMLALILSVTLSRYGSDASGDGGAIPAKFEVTASGTSLYRRDAGHYTD